MTLSIIAYGVRIICRVFHNIRWNLKIMTESDLQCNFSYFRNYIRKFYHKIFIRYDIDAGSFRYFLFQIGDVVAVAHRGRPKQK